MKFSVIIPTFHRNHTLKKCIYHLDAQDFPKDDFEILIVDNSAQSTAKPTADGLMLKYSRLRISYISEVRQGLMFARHAGANAATFEMLAYIDDDSYVSAHWLSEANKFFSKHACSVAGGAISILWDEAPPAWIRQFEQLLGKIDLGEKSYCSSNIYINGGNFFISKSLLKKVRGFNPDQIGNYLIGDGETGLCRKLITNGISIGWIPKAQVSHSQLKKHNATISDLSRRYWNNGAGSMFEFFEKRGFKNTLYIHKLSIIITKFAHTFFHFVISHNSRSRLYERLKYRFELYFYLGQLLYLLNFILNKKFRHRVTYAVIKNGLEV